MSDPIDERYDKAAQMFDELARLETEIDSLRSRLAEAEEVLREIRAVVNESSGVYGFHLNGNLETWDYWPVFGRIDAFLAEKQGITVAEVPYP